MQLILTVLTYGEQQMRAEIQLRPTIPPSIVGNGPKIKEWMQKLVTSMAQDFKHTNEWKCEICGDPAKEMKFNLASWCHLEQPRVNYYLHHLCQYGYGPCHEALLELDAELARQTGCPTPVGQFGPTALFKPQFSFASSCANCKEPKTAEEGAKMFRCGRCKLVRYCSTGCQHADWKRHKTGCKIIESVEWVHPTPEEAYHL